MPLIPKTLREYSDTLEKTMEGSDMSLDRKLDSRRRIRQIFDMAFGVYIKEEINKTDTWRDIQWGQLWSHFTHEVKEIHIQKVEIDNFTTYLMPSIYLGC
jgi:isocitrate/isopropylmalate dehydrogenase